MAFFAAALCLVLGVIAFGGALLSSPGGLWPPADLLASGERPVEEVNQPSGDSAPAPAREKDRGEGRANAGESGAGKQDASKGEKAAEDSDRKAGAGDGSRGDSIEEKLASVPEPQSTEMYLTVPKMGLQNDYVAEGVDEATLMNGAGHAPGTGYPWTPGSNTYIASHVLGYAGTGSYLHFANLPNMAYGDEIFITDANGTTYKYVVSEILEVSIYDTWVMQPTGKTQVSLQTCINPPAYDVRLVVRGDLVDVQPA